jgi:hypothetical protein
MYLPFANFIKVTTEKFGAISNTLTKFDYVAPFKFANSEKRDMI